MRTIISAALLAFAASAGAAPVGPVFSTGTGANGQTYTVELTDEECKSTPETIVYSAQVVMPGDAKLAFYRYDGGTVLGCWFERDGVAIILYVDGDQQRISRDRLTGRGV